jgi:hypothetical protein
VLAGIDRSLQRSAPACCSSVTWALLARREFEPFPGLQMRTFCGLARTVSHAALLLGGAGLPDPLVSVGMPVGEGRALLERLGGSAERKRQVLGGSSGPTFRLLSVARACGGLALGRRSLSGISRIVAISLGFESAHSLSCPLLRLPTPISEAFALICQLFTVVRDPVPLVGDRLALIRDPLALVGKLLARVGHPLTLIRDPHDSCGVAIPIIAVTFAAQPRSVLLQGGIIGPELRGPALDLRAEPLDLDRGSAILLRERAGLQAVQLGPVRFELRKLTLQRGGPPLKRSPLPIATRIPSRSRCFVARCALLVRTRCVHVHDAALRAGADRRFHGYAHSLTRVRIKANQRCALAEAAPNTR